jgi:hypothetical protein
MAAKATDVSIELNDKVLKEQRQLVTLTKCRTQRRLFLEPPITVPPSGHSG